MDWENHLEKNPIQKIEKTVKIKVKLPHVYKKPLARNRIFVQIPFSHSTLKLERGKFKPQNHSFRKNFVRKNFVRKNFVRKLEKNVKLVKIPHVN